MVNLKYKQSTTRGKEPTMKIYNNLPEFAEFTDTGSTYRPGGDAQHVSALLRAISAETLRAADNGDGNIALPLHAKDDLIDEARALLPSQALQNKLQWGIHNIQTGKSRVLRKVAAELGYTIARKSPQAPKKADEGVPGYKETQVKVGRWEYPARKFTDGSIERNTKRDGTGDWINHTN